MMCPGIVCVNRTRLVYGFDIQNNKGSGPVRSERSCQPNDSALKQIIYEPCMFVPELLCANWL